MQIVGFPMQMLGDKMKFSIHYACVWCLSACLLTISKFGSTASIGSYLFEMMLNVQVNSYGHAGTLPPFYATVTQNEDDWPSGLRGVDIMNNRLTDAGAWVYYKLTPVS